jgi:hypothetical protein
MNLSSYEDLIGKKSPSLSFDPNEKIYNKSIKKILISKSKIIQDDHLLIQGLPDYNFLDNIMAEGMTLPDSKARKSHLQHFLTDKAEQDKFLAYFKH